MADHKFDRASQIFTDILGIEPFFNQNTYLLNAIALKKQNKYS